MNFLGYRYIFANIFTPFKYEFMDEKLALLQDNASIQKTVSTSGWSSSNDIKTLAIPGKSHIINLIENM